MVKTGTRGTSPITTNAGQYHIPRLAPRQLQTYHNPTPATGTAIITTSSQGIP